MNELSQVFANYVHEAWSKWMRYLFQQSIRNEDGTVTIPKELVERWTRQMDTNYDDLSASEQLSDIDEAYEIVAIFDDWLA